MLLCALFSCRHFVPVGLVFSPGRLFFRRLFVFFPGCFVFFGAFSRQSPGCFCFLSAFPRPALAWRRRLKTGRQKKGLGPSLPANEIYLPKKSTAVFGCGVFLYFLAIIKAAFPACLFCSLFSLLAASRSPAFPLFFRAAFSARLSPTLAPTPPALPRLPFPRLASTPPAGL